MIVSTKKSHYQKNIYTTQQTKREREREKEKQMMPLKNSYDTLKSERASVGGVVVISTLDREIVVLWGWVM